MATLRTMNRRRRMRTNPSYVMGVYSTDAQGNMQFGYEKAICGRWQRYMPRGKSGAIAAYSAKLGSIEISDADLVEWMEQFEDGHTEQDITDLSAQMAADVITDAGPPPAI